MNGLRADAFSRYIAWAKLHSTARFNLAISGILDYPLDVYKRQERVVSGSLKKPPARK